MDAQFRYFNWADCVETQETIGMLVATAAAAGDLGSAYSLRLHLDAVPPAGNITEEPVQAVEYINTLVFFSSAGSAADRAALPLDIALPTKKIAIFRSDWSDANATYVGFRAGSNCSWFHGDLDAGSIVYSWGGVRWISDLGADNYGRRRKKKKKKKNEKKRKQKKKI